MPNGDIYSRDMRKVKFLFSDMDTQLRNTQATALQGTFDLQLTLTQFRGYSGIGGNQRPALVIDGPCLHMSAQGRRDISSNRCHTSFGLR